MNENIKRIDNKEQVKTGSIQTRNCFELLLITDLIHIELYEVDSIIIPYFTKKEPLAQRKVFIFPRSSSQSMAGPEFKPSSDKEAKLSETELHSTCPFTIVVKAVRSRQPSVFPG